MLESLGFEESEIHDVSVGTWAAPYLRAELGEVQTEVFLDTGLNQSVWVRPSAVERHGLPAFETDVGRGCRVDGLRVLGMEVPGQNAWVLQGDGGRGLGSVGCPAFRERVLAFDPAEPRVAVSDRPGALAGIELDERAVRLPLVRGKVGDLVVSDALRLGDRAVACAFRTLDPTSRAATTVVGDPRQRWKRRLGLGSSTRELTLTLPDGRSLTHGFEQVESLPLHPHHPEIPEIGVAFGMDFLCGFCTVIDFPRREMALIPYGDHPWGREGR